MGALIDAGSRIFKEQALETLTKSMGRVLVDASAIPFVDSTGVEVLVDLTEQLAAKRPRAQAVRRQRHAQARCSNLTGWSHAFEYFDDVNTGVRSFL